MASDSTSKRKNKKWFPLESNPDVMNKYVAGLGLDTSKISFVDVLSTDDWALAMVPKPVFGVVMLFPIKDSSEAHRREEAERIAAEGQIVTDKVYYMKQTVGNACGTVGILHALGNAATIAEGQGFEGLPGGGPLFSEGSFLERFFARTRTMSPEDIANVLEEDDEIEAVHTTAASEGQSTQIPMEQSVDTHFVCLTAVDGCLYELDGRKRGPINHGPCGGENVLERSCEVVQQFMARDPGEVRFTIVALAKSEENG